MSKGMYFLLRETRLPEAVKTLVCEWGKVIYIYLVFVNNSDNLCKVQPSMIHKHMVAECVVYSIPDK